MHLKLPRKLSKEFIEKNADYINWSEVSFFVKIESLPYSFIYKFVEEWDWKIIASTQELSEEFILEFDKYLPPKVILECQLISETYTLRHLSEFTVGEIFYYHVIDHRKKEHLKSKREKIIKNYKKDKGLIQWLKRKWSLLKTSFR